MGLFSGVKVDVQGVQLDSGAAAFLEPMLAGAGASLGRWLEGLAYREIEKIRAAGGEGNVRRLSFAERAILAHLLHETNSLDTKRVPWISRAHFAARAGLSKIAIGHAVKALEDAGDLISKVANPEKGRNGPPPLVYSFTPKGAQTAFTAFPESDRTMAAISTWEDLIGYPGKGEPVQTPVISGFVAQQEKIDQFLEGHAGEPRCACGHSKSEHDDGQNGLCTLCACDGYEVPEA